MKYRTSKKQWNSRSWHGSRDNQHWRKAMVLTTYRAAKQDGRLNKGLAAGSDMTEDGNKADTHKSEDRQDSCMTSKPGYMACCMHKGEYKSVFDIMFILLEVDYLVQPRPMLI